MHTINLMKDLSDRGLQFLIVFTLTVFNCSVAFSQEVEHNYEMKPQKTDCHTLDLDGVEDEKAAIDSIESKQFRYDQHFKLNAPTGFQGAWFYSCDHDTGFLIVKIDSEQLLYTGIATSQWEAMIASKDPIGYYYDEIEGKKKRYRSP